MGVVGLVLKRVIHRLYVADLRGHRYDFALLELVCCLLELYAEQWLESRVRRGIPLAKQEALPGAGSG